MRAGAMHPFYLCVSAFYLLSLSGIYVFLIVFFVFCFFAFLLYFYFLMLLLELCRCSYDSSSPADHVPDWQPRILLGISMVEARLVNNVKKTHTTHFGIFKTPST